jgi:DNA mismatch repair protein MutS
MSFPSLLYPYAEPALQAAEPGHFRDLNLDQVVAAVTASRQEYALAAFFHHLPLDAGVVRFRQAVMRDLEDAALFGIIERFANRMREMRATLVQAERHYYLLQRQRALLDAIAQYCEALRELHRNLAARDTLNSAGLRGFRDGLAAYVDGDRFAELSGGARRLLDALGEVRYCILLDGDRVSVRRFDGEPDYAPQIEKTFARFRQRDAEEHAFSFTNLPQMNHVEAQILEGVAHLHGELFADIETFCGRHAAAAPATEASAETGSALAFARYPFIEDGVARFDREVQFYLAWLGFIAPMRRVGLRFSYPDFAGAVRSIRATQTFDIALADKLLADERLPVLNGFRLDGAERIIVVTGPNQGGKTTFARTFGQLHHLAGLGCCVPGEDLRLILCDAVYTHFERQEQLATRRSKLEDDLVRLHETLASASGDSILILNEIFDSTTYDDALYLSRRILTRLLELDARCVWVTFLDELSHCGKEVVSMVSSTAPDDPTARTYRIERRAADGLAYALSLAEKHRLTRNALLQRLPS